MPREESACLVTPWYCSGIDHHLLPSSTIWLPEHMPLLKGIPSVALCSACVLSLDPPVLLSALKRMQTEVDSSGQSMYFGSMQLSYSLPSVACLLMKAHVCWLGN